MRACALCPDSSLSDDEKPSSLRPMLALCFGLDFLPELQLDAFAFAFLRALKYLLAAAKVTHTRPVFLANRIRCVGLVYVSSLCAV